MTQNLSIVIPAKNEAKGLATFLPRLHEIYPEAEIIVVDDGSDDDTRKICEDSRIRIVTHAYSKGNGAAIKSGARIAKGDVIVFMDGDGQHCPEDIEKLLKKIDEGFDMAIGARDSKSQANLGRLAANSFYNKFASWMVGHRVKDLTSGFRAAKAEMFKQFLSILPNGFSYPTTSTMAFFRAGYSVGYVPISVEKRIGKSHISLVKDGLRFLLIIFKVGTLYSPLKLFVPISLSFFVTGLSYYAYTFSFFGRFTNMSALLLSTAVLIFLMGLVSEQITTLMYSLKGGSRSTDFNIDTSRKDS